MGRNMFTMTSEGFDDLNVRLEQATGRALQAIVEAVDDETQQVAQDMRDLAPRDTGELHDSIEAIVDGPSGLVRASAPHSRFVEFGTSVAPAQPYATPASEQSRTRFPKRLSDAVGEELER